MKKYSLLLLMMMFVLVACAKDDKKAFVVGFTDYPPLGFKDERGEIQGFDIDLAKAVFERIGQDVEFQYINWDTKTMELNSGSIDAIWNGFTVTEERKQEVLFSASYLDNAVVIIVRADDERITQAEDLNGLYIAVESESSAQHFLEDNAASFDAIVLNRFTSVSEALLDLKAGNSDALLADEIYARYITRESKDYKIIESVRLNAEEYAIGLRKTDTATADLINQTLRELIADGTASEISIKWFGEDLIKR